MTENNNSRLRLTIRVGRQTLAFAQTDGADETAVTYEPFVVKSGVSMAANLREAFKTNDLLLQTTTQRARVLIDTDVLVVPVELFSEDTMDDMMHHAFPDTAADAVAYNVMPYLNAVGVFAVNRDLRLVLDDHFRDVQLLAALGPVCHHLHQRSFTGSARKLYGYFHEKRLDVMCFQQNRFKFYNSFDAGRSYDALYFLLYVWKQLQLSPQQDELHLAGEIPDAERFGQQLRRFVQKVFVVNPQADFAQLPVAKVKGMTYDMMALLARGR
ncbi:MAG: DUF3822 family protein [Prevotella sp.]|nr:DUF3822 family protein [Prevotella sp.]